MNWQKLNDTDTYVNLWNKFKGLFHRKKRDDSEEKTESINETDIDNDASEYDGKNSSEDFSFQDEQSIRNNESRGNTANNVPQQINLVKIAKICFKHWYLYPIWCGIAFVVACIIIIPVPRTYTSTVKLAPELSNMMGGNSSISSLASQFGVNLGNMKMGGGDAILPELYPDLISSADFETKLFSIRVKTVDDSVNTTYYDYLLNHQKKSKLAEHIDGIISKFQSDNNEDSVIYAGGSDNPYNVNPFRMTKDQYRVCNSIGDNVSCAVDKKNYVISITVKDQDPLIAATIADSVKLHLQQFITKYRTQKAQNDLNYVLKLQSDAKKRYEKARREYADYSDAHQDAVLQEYQSKTEDLENEMQLRYNTYSALATQVQAARAKVREQTPAFTTLQSATVPIKPSGPKRMIFCALFIAVAFVFVTIYCVAKDELKGEQQNERKPSFKNIHGKKAETTASEEPDNPKPTPEE